MKWQTEKVRCYRNTNNRRAHLLFTAVLQQASGILWRGFYCTASHTQKAPVLLSYNPTNVCFNLRIFLQHKQFSNLIRRLNMRSCFGRVRVQSW